MNELALHVLDILGNSIRAGALHIGLTIVESLSQNIYQIEIEDDGRGMDEATLKDVFNPWVTTRKERRVGMGLSLIKQAAEMCGGEIKISSDPKSGTRLCVRFEYLHLDRPVAGDMSGAVVMTAASSSKIDLVYTHTTDVGTYRFSSHEVLDILGGVALDNASIMRAVQEMVQSNLDEICAEGEEPVALSRMGH